MTYVEQIIDFFEDALRSRSSSASCGKGRENAGIIAAYFVFLMCSGIVLRQFSDRDFSVVLTLGAGCQTLGFFLLLQKVRSSRSVAGISSRTLEMYVLVYVFRLSSTLVKNGYLPVDRSGDWVYQAADIASLLLVVQLLYCIHKSLKLTYQSGLDTLPIWRAVPACIAMGVFLHGDLNRSRFFDTTWTIGMNLDTIAMLPQLWMLVKKGGEVEALTSNFVALIALSRAMSFAFWFYGYTELAPKKGGFNTAGWLIIGAHAAQLLLSGDFMYHYVSAKMGARAMVLPTSGACDV